MKPIGKYEVIAEIGTGGMGTIYRARDQVLDREVALKVLRTDGDLDPELKERFYREARACARLAHPNIITVHDLGEAGGEVFIAMELLSGNDLRKLLTENRSFTLAQKVDLMAQVCDGLAHAHGQQLVHRDIKPSNIFVCDDLRAKLLDFGIARMPTSNLTMAGKVLGSPNYMAPEQIRGGKCDSRSDLFSAAIVFSEFLTRAHPFQDEFIPRRIVASQPDSLRQKNPEIPEALEALLFRVLEKDPEKRLQTAGEFAAGLRAVLEALPASAPEPAATPIPAPIPDPVPEPVQTAPSAPLPVVDEAAEQRVAEFLRLVSDFDEGVDKRDAGAARAALEQMRRLSSADSRFVLAVSDCESRLNAMAPPTPVLAPPPPVPVQAPPAPAIPPKVEAAKPPSPKSNLTLVATVAGIVILLALSFWLKNRGHAVASDPVKIEPSVATAAVSAATANLMGTPDSQGKLLAVLKQGQTVNIIAIPDLRDRDYAKVQPAVTDKPLPAGFMRTADLSSWSGNDAGAAFSILELFAPADTSGESELTAQLQKWNEFIARFPASPRIAAANLESARMELALAGAGKSAGKPAAELEPHLENARKALANVTGSPELESQAAQMRLQLGEPVKPPGGPAAPGPTPEQILRTRVNSLWQDGKYEQATQVVDQILASSPNHPGALFWKKKIRASQEAEARAQ
jgi:tRNA A-37 threonylcarbamoyl transferase component Bud32